MLGLKPKTNHQIEIKEYHQFSRFKLVIFLALFLAIGGIAVCFYYIYCNIYTAVNQAKSQLMLDPFLSQEPIDFDKFDKVQKAWKDKAEQPAKELTRDPFAFKVVATSTPKNLKK